VFVTVSYFILVQYLQTRLQPTQVEHLEVLHSKVMLLALPNNIRLLLKWVTNTLDYDRKKFYNTDAVPNRILFLFFAKRSLSKDYRNIFPIFFATKITSHAEGYYLQWRNSSYLPSPIPLPRGLWIPRVALFSLLCLSRGLYNKTFTAVIVAV
jgi:hypothetical protein